MNPTLFSLLGVILVSLISLTAIVVLFISESFLCRILFFLVSLSVGALFGDAFIHLIPSSFENFATVNVASILILAGILMFFALEKFLHWHHHHADVGEPEDHTIHPVGPMVIMADILHNFIDGVVIAASFYLSTTAGIATTIAVMLHEIPHEIGNVALLIHAGFTRRRAVIINCFSALSAILGAILVILISSQAVSIAYYLIPFAAGSFIYIAGSDLVPELHKDVGVKKALIQLIGILLGILMMFALLLVEG
ncbi:MAG: ZIP family metal transporter [bacterium]|nr:ZIP family metal transporter [bacterium]